MKNLTEWGLAGAILERVSRFDYSLPWNLPWYATDGNAK